MFAFAIYDARARRLFLARDRFGEKPLYYALQGGTFFFASELAAIAAHRAFRAESDRRALQKYFAYGFIPSPNTLFRDAMKLPAGGLLSFDFTRGTAVPSRYWQFRIEPPARTVRKDDAVAELRFLLAQAVERRLMSDVPLGFFLSGGIDSSAILAAASERVPAASLNSFCIGFTEPSFDESAYARIVAEAVGARHHEKRLDLALARDLSVTVLARMDEPLGDPSLVATYLLAAFAREHVTVALSGDGGDELFAGYDPFAALGPAAAYRASVPQTVHRLLRAGAAMMPISSRNMALDFKLRRALAGLGHPPSLWNPVWMAPLAPEQIAELFGEPCEPEDLFSEAIALWNGSPDLHIVDRTLEFFTNLYLADNILTKVDRAAMMHSLESRAPFLDVDLVEFVRRLPHELKYRRGVRKWVLKEAVRGLVPDAVLRRAKKGFGLPLVAWLKDFAPVDGGPHARAGGADATWALDRWSSHAAGRADHRQFLWCWYALHHFGAAGPGI
jgi:asparagine synthase (glutamine-hydrolysing)